MKIDIGSKIHKKMTEQDKFYGTTTIGERGQVVIPVQVRKDLNLQPGDQLMVMGKFGKVVAFVKADEFEQLVKMILNNLGGSGMEKHIKDYMGKIFGKSIIK